MSIPRKLSHTRVRWDCVEGRDLGELKYRLDRLTAVGWRPVGNLVIDKRGNPPTTWYLQAVTRFESDENVLSTR